MRLNTCSEGISYARELEQASAALYEEAAAQYPEVADTLRGYAAANKKNVSNVERAYYGVITDAIEGCFAFDLESDDHALNVDLPQETGCAAALSKDAVTVQDGAIMVACPYCGAAYQVVEEPKW